MAGLTYPKEKEMKFIMFLPPGTYTTQELVKISGLSDVSVKAVMIKHGAILSQQRSNRNLSVNVYTWPGYKVKKVGEAAS